MPMLLSDRHRVIFIHVPKAAGSSIGSALRDVCSDARPHPDRDQLAEGWLWMHPLASIIKDRVGEWERYFKFAFVRNPWGRLVSWYNMGVRNRRYMAGHLHSVACDFADFLQEPDESYEGIDRRRPQVDFICDAAGHCLVDFVGRFETLEADFATVCQRIGVAARLPHHNRTDPVDYRIYYTPALRELVAKRFARDIAAFGYDF